MGLEEREGEEKMLGRVHKSNDFHRKFSLRMREKGRGGERSERETGAMNNAMFWRKHGYTNETGHSKLSTLDFSPDLCRDFDLSG